MSHQQTPHGTSPSSPKLSRPSTAEGLGAIDPGFPAIDVVSSLLAKLQSASDAVAENPPQRGEAEFESKLALVRLGIATSLFYALRTKHPATAAHGLRVALVCSSWAEHLNLGPSQRDRIEVAALLHDVGKIGIPDRILRKPGKLTVDEQLAMDSCASLGCEILKGCTSDPDLLDIVRYSSAWYDSRRNGDAPRGDALPLGARMLAIADAFDAMTTEQVYRAAFSRDRAIAELIRGSGTQFDPQLIQDFSRLLEARPEVLQGTMVHRWLQQLRPEDSASFWSGKTSNTERPKEIVRRETRFSQKLLGKLKDGVVFTDNEGNITEWNIAMERLTGLPSDAMVGTQWSASAIHMRDPDQDENDEPICHLQECLRTGENVRRSMVLQSPGTKPISIRLEIAPVFGDHPGSLGTVVTVHDQSDREQLERKLDSLHEQTRLDGLTRVANRAHFDKTLDEFVAKTMKGGPTFSLVICDIDHFKRINDTYGHPAGDDALKVFANLMRSHSRDGDLVARYGGEEFLLLAPSCDNATGAKRAEMIRQALEALPIESLGNECITASFGVTEFQSGDTAETVLARADRALLKAKDNGRNRVIQLGLGKMSETTEPAQRTGWFEWLLGAGENATTEVDILTPVPVDLAIEKLRGFIADHHAEIIGVAENQLKLKIHSGSAPGGRRRVDHKISFNATLTLSEAQKDELLTEKATPGGATKVHLELAPIRIRDRRRREMKAAVTQLVSSFRCYLMGEIISG